jgi:hypothetical protein
VCGSIHRELGDRVKPVLTAGFTHEEIASLQTLTNDDVNRADLALWRPGEPPQPLNAHSAIRHA